VPIHPHRIIRHLAQRGFANTRSVILNYGIVTNETLADTNCGAPETCVRSIGRRATAGMALFTRLAARYPTVAGLSRTVACDVAPMTDSRPKSGCGRGHRADRKRGRAYAVMLLLGWVWHRVPNAANQSSSARRSLRCDALFVVASAFCAISFHLFGGGWIIRNLNGMESLHRPGGHAWLPPLACCSNFALRGRRRYGRRACATRLGLDAR
jgi:hypothetical protein